MSEQGDDFTATGPEDQLDLFEATLKSQPELTVGGLLGPGPADDKEALVLNCIIRWASKGLEYEADPRQVEKLLKEMKLSGEGVKGAVTPGTEPLPHRIQDELELSKTKHARFRGLALR